MSGRGGHGGHRTPSEAEVTAAPPSPRRRQPRDAAGGTGGMRGRPLSGLLADHSPWPGHRAPLGPPAVTRMCVWHCHHLSPVSPGEPARGGAREGAAKGRRRERPEPGRAARSPRLGWRWRRRRSGLGTFGDIRDTRGPRTGRVPRRALPLLMLMGSAVKSALKGAFVSPGGASIHLPPSPRALRPKAAPWGLLRRGPVPNLGGFGGFGGLGAWRQRG
ncbi:uncharacterized protein LOC134420569 isoform X1 [Melospiza melodia melodia]|uniref:uncharacterized protein LOC134420569 isoform X1 n=1 Tax=Melospiza melodia melodia TaxID=1914991 RepID=UPI002FD255CC